LRLFSDNVEKNILKPDRPQIITWRMRFACWIKKATNTLAEYVIFTALPLGHLLLESASKLFLTPLPGWYRYKLILKFILRTYPSLKELLRVSFATPLH
jgi:hypothetical protein